MEVIYCSGALAFCSTFEVFFKLRISSVSTIDGGGADSNPDSTNASLDFQKKKDIMI
jgi:hypothetical protein